MSRPGTSDDNGRTSDGIRVWWDPGSVLSLFGIALASGLLVRVLFYALYGGRVPEGGAWLVLRSFWTGLRFDVAAASMLLLPVALLALLPLPGRAHRLRARACIVCALVLIAAATLLGVGDCLYYAHAAKRVSYEPLVLWGSALRLFAFAYDEHPLLMPVLAVAAVAPFLWIGRALIGRAERAGPPPLRAAALWLVVAGLLVLGARGGRDRLRLGDAYTSTVTVTNHAGLNSLVSFVHALDEDRSLYEFMPDHKAVARVREVLGADGERFVSEDYPVLRQSARTETALSGPDDPLDLCVILVESLSAYPIGFFGDENGATPNLDRLMERSVVFDRFFSSGSRSSNGIFATLFSVPTLLGSPVLHTELILNRYRSLAAILREQGYSTKFIYGGVYEFTNAEGVLRASGFEEVIGEPLPGDPDAERTPWGYHDRPMFRRLLHELDRPSEGPRLTVFFTQSMHNRDLPSHADVDDLKRRFPKGLPDARYYRLLAYFDDCLGRFIDEAAKRPFHERTVYVLLADHTNHRRDGLFDNYHIPLVIHAPGRLKPAVYSTTGGQCDVLPTALALLGVETRHASFGTDLLARARRGDPGFAFLSFGDSFGWTEGPWLLQAFQSDVPPRLFHIDRDPLLATDYAGSDPAVASDLDDKARAFLQLARRLLVENRIAPPPEPRAAASSR